MTILPAMRPVLAGTLALFMSGAALAGQPYLTDDPEPTDTGLSDDPPPGKSSFAAAEEEALRRAASMVELRW